MTEERVCAIQSLVPAKAPATEISPRSFGLFCGALCGLIGCWPVWRASGPPLGWVLAAGVLMVLAALNFPHLLIWPARGWCAFGKGIGWLNTRILLTVAFFLLVVPVGLLRRILQDDPLQRRFESDRESYRCRSDPRSSDHLRKKY